MKYLKGFNEHFIFESVEDIYKELITNWKQEQKKLGKNIKPGQGTRNRLMKQAKIKFSETKRSADNVPTQSPNKSIDYSKLFKKDMEFHNPQGKLVGKIISLNLSAKFCTSCGNKLKENAKFCTDCGKRVYNIIYKNLIDNEEYGFGFDEFYNKLKQAGWNNTEEQTIKEPEKIEKPEDKKSVTSPKSSRNPEFDKLCDQYSKMKGADLTALNLIKKMAEKEKEEFIKVNMIKRLIGNLED
jgi:hypothetical protein